MKHNRFYSIMAIALAVVGLGVFTQTATAQLPGAIFTTLADGTRVNANIYQNMEDVYLDGGPPLNAPAGAAALLPGDYYFQVTDPSGKKLLSEDPVKCRRFTVSSDGVIVAVVTATTSVKIKGVVTPIDCQHVTGVDEDHVELGAITVQLYPYSKTPNNGGVYKVWVTPVGAFVGDVEEVDNPLYFHGFVPRYSKTDNYKVIRNGPPCEEPRLTIRKFKDCNANGVWDEGEDPIIGWLIELKDPQGVTNTLATPVEDYLALPAGTWQICEEVKSDWSQTALVVDFIDVLPAYPCADVDVVDECAGETHEVIFGNVPLQCIKVFKFYDGNGDGDSDGDSGIEAFAFTLEGTNVKGEPVGPTTDVTDETGHVQFCGLLPGSYTVTEIVPTDSPPCVWKRTTPETDTVTVEVSGCVEPDLVEFGNVITGTACFYTKGFWQNKNGLKLLTEADRDYVNGLLPYQAPPSAYFAAGDEPFDGYFSPGEVGGEPVAEAFNVKNPDDPDAEGQAWAAGTWQAEISHFLTDSNADAELHGHKEQLAQQLLAFIFNVRFGFGSVNAVIQEPGLWEGPAKDLIDQAILAWQVGDPGVRDYYEGILDSLNNRHCEPGVKYILPEPPESCVPVTY